MKPECQDCERLRLEVARLRDLVEVVCRKLAANAGRNPSVLKAGRPMWTHFIPSEYLPLWERRKTS